MDVDLAALEYPKGYLSSDKQGQRKFCMIKSDFDSVSELTSPEVVRELRRYVRIANVIGSVLNCNQLLLLYLRFSSASIQLEMSIHPWRCLPIENRRESEQTILRLQKDSRFK